MPCRRREARRLADLAATTTLGAPDKEVDDVASWIAKSRQTAAEPSKSKATQPQHKRRKRGSDEENGSEDEAAGVAALAGAKVAADTGDLLEGETLVLTLADQPLLDEKGRLLEEQEDKLENVLQREQSKRNKARRAATKSGQPLWQEDGKVRSLLDKYDEEEEALGMMIDDEGRLRLQQQQQEEVRKRLAEGAARLESAAVGVGDASAAAAAAGGGGIEPGQQGDFYTAGEMEAMQQPKKKKKKRKLRSKVADEGEEGGGGLDLDALEAAAAADGGNDLGSRAQRSSRREQKEAEQAAAVATKAARFEAALEKANWASTFLRPEVAAAAAAGGEDEDAVDAELSESLARVRRMAQQNTSAAAGGAGSSSGREGGEAGVGPGSSSLQALAAGLAKKRQADEEAQAAAGKAGDDTGEHGGRGVWEGDCMPGHGSAASVL